MMCRRTEPFEDYQFGKNQDCSTNNRSIKPTNSEFVDPTGYMYRCCNWHWYPTQTDDVWLIQNSFGTGWGDAGFIRLRNEGGLGVSGMNQHIKWVTVV